MRIHFYVRNRLIVVSVLSAQYVLLCEGWFASKSYSVILPSLVVVLHDSVRHLICFS